MPKPAPQQQDLAGGTWWDNHAPGTLGGMRCSQVLLIYPWVWFSVVTTPSSVVLLQLGNLFGLGQVLLLGCSSHLTCVGMAGACGRPGSGNTLCWAVFLQLTGKRSYFSPLCSLLISKPGPSLQEDPLIGALIQVQIKPNGNGSLGQDAPLHVCHRQGTFSEFATCASWDFHFARSALETKTYEGRTVAKIKWQFLLVGRKCLAFTGWLAFQSYYRCGS